MAVLLTFEKPGNIILSELGTCYNIVMDTSDTIAASLPVIAPIHSTPSKKALMKQKLSKIRFPSSSTDEVSATIEYPDRKKDARKMELDLEDTDECIPAKDPDLSLPAKNHSTFSLHAQSESSSHNPIMHKINKSTSSLSSLIPSSLSGHRDYPKPPGLDSAGGSTSVSQHIPPSASRSRSNSMASNSLNMHTPMPHSLYPSPNKQPSSFSGSSNARYLATNNDHTFLTSNNTINTLQPPSLNNKKQSHSASASISYQPDNEAPLSKSIPSSSLPYFSSIGSPFQGPAAVLTPPTVLAPLHKVPSSSVQSTVSAITNSHSSPSHTISNHPNSSVAESISTTSRQKRGTGLLQNACRTSHQQSHSNLKDKDLAQDDKDGLYNDHSVYTNTVSNQSKSAISTTSNYYSCPSTNIDRSNEEIVETTRSKIHLLSPKIIAEFVSLQNSIRSGMKKRMDYIQKENSNLISELNGAYENLENAEKHLRTQIADLDKYLQNLATKKETDIKNLHQHGLFENLNGLTARIDTVKKNMASDKETIRSFDVKLDLLEKRKMNYEARNKSIKKIFLLISAISSICLFFRYYFF